MNFRLSAEDKKLPVFIMCSDDGQDDCQQLKPKGSDASFLTTVIAVTILLMLSIVFRRVIVNVLVFVLRVVFFCNAVHVRCSASGFCVITKFYFRIECFDGSEVTGKANNPIVQRQYCAVEEIIEVELRSRRGKFIYSSMLRQGSIFGLDPPQI